MKTHKKLFAVITLMCFIFTLLPMSAFAENQDSTSKSDNPISHDKSYIEIPDDLYTTAAISLKVKFVDDNGILTTSTGSVYCWIKQDGKIIYNIGQYLGIIDFVFEEGNMYGDDACFGIENVQSDSMIRFYLDKGIYTICYAFEKPEYQSEILIEPKSTKVHEISVISYGMCGENAIWELSEDGVLTISGTGSMYDSSEIPWYGRSSSIKQVIIEDGITTIAAGAFYWCSNLETVSLPESLEYIGEQAFEGCKKLSNIDLPNGVKFIGNAAFYQCNNISEISIPKSVVKIDKNPFYGMEGLVTIVVEDGNKNYYSDEYGALMSKDGKFICFPANSPLVEYTVPEGIKEIGIRAFAGADKIERIVLQSGVKMIGSEAFYNTDNLQELVLPETLTTLNDGAFDSCGLKKVELPDSLINIGVQAFRFSHFESITIPKNVRSIGYQPFAGRGDIPITVDEENPYFYYVDSALYEKLESGVRLITCLTDATEFTIPDGVTRIERSAFIDAENMTALYIPSSVKSIGRQILMGNRNDIFVTDVYYAGSELDWEDVIVHTSNVGLQNATIHYAIELSEKLVSAEKSYLEIQDAVLIDALFPLKLKFNDEDGNPTVSTGSVYCWIEKNGEFYEYYGFEFHPENINGGTWHGNFENGLFYASIEGTKTNSMFKMDIYEAGEYTICYAFEKPTFQDGVFVRPVVTKEHVISVTIPTNITTQAVANGVLLELNENNEYDIEVISGCEGTKVVVAFYSSDGELYDYNVVYHHSEAINVETEYNFVGELGEVVFTVFDTGVLGEHQVTLSVQDFYDLTFNINVVDGKNSDDTEDDNDSTGDNTDDSDNSGSTGDSTGTGSGNTGGVSGTGGAIGGGSSGGGGGGVISSKPVEITSPDESIKLSKEQVDVEVWGAAASALSNDENAKVIISTGSSTSISAKDESGQEVVSFDKPIKVTVPIGADVLKSAKDKSKLTLALVTTDEKGNTTLEYVGGIYDSKADSFTAYTDKPGDYVLVEKSDIVKMDMFIDNKDSVINNTTATNDVAPFILNGRTMVPVAFIMDNMGCKVDWFGDERKVVITLPDGNQLSMIIDQEIPGFGGIPTIKNDRTMVPIAYIADAMGAKVMWVEDERRVVIVK